MGKENLFSLKNYFFKIVLKNLKNKFKKNITRSTRSSALPHFATLIQDRSDLAQGERNGKASMCRQGERRENNSFKKKYVLSSSGFSFIEVALTIAIIGMMITALFSLQFGAFRNVTLEHAILSRIFYIKNIYYNPQDFQKLQKDKTFTQDIPDPKIKIVSKYLDVPEKSEVAKKFENVFLVKATGSWQGMQTEQQETLVTFVFSRPKEEKSQ